MPNVGTLPFNGNVSYIGDLTRFDNGDVILNIGVIQNSRRQDSEGNWTDGEPTSVNVLLRNHLAENAKRSVKVGQRVIAVGPMRVRNWTDREGNERSTTEIVAREFGPSLQFGTTEFTKRVSSSRSTSQVPPPPLPEDEASESSEDETTQEEALNF